MSYTNADYLCHARKKRGSKYSGGFITLNGRSNNSSAYNHDYYMKNKQKWSNKGAAMGSFKNPLGGLLNKWRDKAINSISDFMVDLSVAYINKMLSDDRIANLRLEEIAYNKFSPVVNKMVDDAVDRATKKATQNVNNMVTNAVNDTVNKATNTATKEANDAVSQVTDWLKKKR